MKKLIDTILAGKRKRFLRRQAIYQTSARVSEMDLFRVARRLDCKLTVDLSKWLLSAGYGIIENSLSFREDWFCLLDDGPLKGDVAFARDNQDNIYAYDPGDGAIYFIGSNNNGYARLADDFCSFLRELVKRNYDLAAWRDSLTLQHFGAAGSTSPQQAT
jgi:hypothetical protein